MQTNSIKNNLKTVVAIVVFIAFWLFAFAYIIGGKYFEKRMPNMSWQYNQVFHQSWNFFTQPAIYNDKLVVVLNNENKAKPDSIYVLDELWKLKRSKFIYAKENAWDHIMFRQIRFLRMALHNKSLVSYNDGDSLNTKLYNNLVALKSNKMLLNNFEIFCKEMLNYKQVNTLPNTTFQILLYTDYTTAFANNKQQLTGSHLIFKSNWNQLANEKK